MKQCRHRTGAHPIDATSISIDNCNKCDAVHITLVNADGEPYTRARIHHEDVERVAKELLDQAALIRKRKLAKVN